MRRPFVMLLALAIPVALPAQADSAKAPDPIPQLVARLDLERYKATVKGLTQFGDRRQGTERNRKAVDWIEAQLKSYGCANTERITYEFTTPPRTAGRGGPRPQTNAGQGGSRIRGNRGRTGVNTDSLAQ